MNAIAFVLAATTLAVEEPVEPPPPPKGTIDGTPASKGQTNLDGLDRFARGPELPDKLEDVTELQLSAGGIFSTGNARSLAATGAGTFRLRRSIHQFSTEFAANYAQAATNPEEDLETTVGNAQGRVRYDVFFARHFSAFAMTTARHDPFQGLRLRLNVDPGVAFYIFTRQKHRLWFEAGYDFQYDLMTDVATLAHDEAGNIIYDERGAPVIAQEQVRYNHAARLFGGYINRLSDHVTLDIGLEYLQSFLRAKQWRVNLDAGLTTRLNERLSFATRFTMRVDNTPAQAIEKIDTMTSVNLVVNLI